MAKPTKVRFGYVIESEMLNKVLLEKIVLRNESHIFVLVLFHTSLSNGALFVFNSLLHGSMIDTFLHPLNISIDSLTVDAAVKSTNRVLFNAGSTFWTALLHVLERVLFNIRPFYAILPGDWEIPIEYIYILRPTSLSCSPRTTQHHSVSPPKAS